MNFLNKNIKSIGVCLALFFATLSYAQQGDVTINQDENLPKLLALKKAVNTSENDSGKYRIQIYSGDRKNAEKQKSAFEGKIFKWQTTLVYETPNYKVWVGKFRTRLEADRALITIKEDFPSAFIFKPKLKDKK